MKTKNLIIIFIILLITLACGLAIILFERNNWPVGNRQSGENKVEQIQVTMLISGAQYRTEMKPDSSVYDLMKNLREQKKIDFSGHDYSGMGFFIEEINGVRNNPPNPLYQGGSGKNWLYYVNGRLASIGVSFYKLKNNDTIEWKYENKSL
jgi:hypothetical protein